MPRWTPGDGPFPRYVLPALELRRIVAEARASGESFSLVYVRLPGVHGDDTWRASAAGPRVELNISGDSERCLSDGKPCDKELTQWAEADFLTRKTRLFFPHPIIAEADGELPCID